MRLIRKQDADGSYWIRPAFKSEDYAVPPRVLRTINSWQGDHMNVDDLMKERDGPFGGMVDMGREVHDGKTWVLLLDETYGYCIEVEVTKVGLGTVVPVDPERAYRTACAYDQKQTLHRVVHE